MYDLKQRVTKPETFTPQVAFQGSLASSQKFPLLKHTIKETGNCGSSSRTPTLPPERHPWYPSNAISGRRNKGGVSEIQRGLNLGSHLQSPFCCPQSSERKKAERKLGKKQRCQEGFWKS